jgi:hypothetical protein
MKAKAREDKSIYISHGYILDDLGFSPEEAAAIKLKASLHAEILRLVEKRKLKAPIALSLMGFIGSSRTKSRAK